MKKGGGLPSIRRVVVGLLESAQKAAFPDVEAEVMIVKNKHSDYQYNSAMQIFNQLRIAGKTNGMKKANDAAEVIIKHIPENDVLESATVSGPGFICINLNAEYVLKNVKSILVNGVTPPDNLEKKRIVVDFSSPNIAKEMHVGHLRSTIIGDTLCRIFEFCGHDVLRTNHIGDWGTQFGMLITHLKDKIPDFATRSDVPIADLQAFYKEAKVRFDSDPEFKRRSQLEVVALQAGTSEETTKGWRLIVDISKREFEKLYSRMDIRLHEKGESFYNPMLPGVVETLRQKGVVTKTDGAQCIWAANPKAPKAAVVPIIVQKSDGGYGYATTDFAAIIHRFHELKADWSIYVVDSGQSSHFERIFETARQVGLIDPNVHRAEHVGFGVVLGEDGKKFKTRSGEVVKLVDLLDQARDGAKKVIEEKNAERGDNMEDAEIMRAAEIVGTACVKYADLHCNRLNNYTFSFERMLDQKGNTAVYLLYAYARLASIFRKASVNVEDLVKKDVNKLVLKEPGEIRLAKSLLTFTEEIELVHEDLMPHHITDFVYRIAIELSGFYRDCRVNDPANPETTTSRLLLCEATRRVIRKSFDLLGMECLERL